MTRVMFVCHGNICRSTMAESLLTKLVEDRNIEDKFVIDSCATSRDEIGNPVHEGTVKKLKKEGVKVVPHFAKQLSIEDKDNFDYFIGMDEINIENMKKILGDTNKIFKMKSFINDKSDVKDPWYTGNFDETYNDLKASLEGFLKYLGY